mmetsp:Transcript_41250/g.124733  ORF Transcript_41250/g.124733 Transcript_41250/m.124733 type:complete len:218 (+) Transcript_41250:702-1355(+)
MVDEGPHLPGPHVVHTIKIRDVHRTAVGGWVPLVMLVHIEAKEDDVDAVQVLKNDDAFAPEIELLGVILEGVPSLHPLADIETPVHRGHLADGDVTPHVDSLACLVLRHFLRLHLGLRRLVHIQPHLLPHMLLQVLAQFRTRQILGHGSCGRPLRHSPLLPILDGTLGTNVLRSLILVLTGVEQPTDLVDPTFALVALDPGFLVDLVVFLFNESGLR